MFSQQWAGNRQSRLTLHLVMLTALALGILYLIPASAAEDEQTLLTLEGDRISALPEKPDIQGSAINPAQTIQAYYALLQADVRQDLETVQNALLALIPDYDVAFAAADSAEITEVKSDLDVIWADIRTIHRKYFTAEVARLLDTAYDSAFATSAVQPRHERETMISGEKSRVQQLRAQEHIPE